MELPFHLRALPPESLNVLRFFGTLDEPLAHASIIMEEAGLSERAFGKVVRRLVTKGYLQMGGDHLYRLTDFGQRAVDELSGYEESAPPNQARDDYKPAAAQRQTRRLLVVVPRRMAAGVSSRVQVGFDRGEDPSPVELVVRLSVVNGEPLRPQERTYNLSQAADYQIFNVTPGRYTRMRLRVQVYQLGPNPDDIAVAGGLYVDVPVALAAAADDDRMAFAADIITTV
ncbi:MAG: hypothetical protein HXY41_02205 [Chloroflexi bacterium]|nr:hypothetical protein [Chloroflexota bacterium]